MQTFLPLADFEATALILDWRRLGKQRVEALQILRTLSGASKGWANHPAVVMWRGHPLALQAYQDAMVREWVRRGYRNTIELAGVHISPTDLPPWFGDPAFHASHRSNLLRKDAAHYGRFGWAEPPDLPYIWPT
jgi:hypothetical protein